MHPFSRKGGGRNQWDEDSLKEARREQEHSISETSLLMRTRQSYLK
jgi:hypothetical protein